MILLKWKRFFHIQITFEAFLLEVLPIFLCNESICFDFITARRLFYYSIHKTLFSFIDFINEKDGMLLHPNSVLWGF